MLRLTIRRIPAITSRFHNVNSTVLVIQVSVPLVTIGKMTVRRSLSFVQTVMVVSSEFRRLQISDNCVGRYWNLLTATYPVIRTSAVYSHYVCFAFELVGLHTVRLTHRISSSK